MKPAPGFSARMRRALFTIAAAAFVLFLAFSANASQLAVAQKPPVPEPSLPRQGVSAPIVTRDAHHDTSPALRDLPPSTTPGTASPALPVPDDETAPSDQPPGPTNAPPILPGPSGPAPAAALSFEGIPQSSSVCNCAPPDTDGDIGPNHYVQIVNTALQVFSRAGVSLLGPVGINTVWAGFGGKCEAQNDGDPIVQHDHLADRWLISQFAVKTGGPYFECIAISTTPDPTGSYHRYAFFYDNVQFPDYPKFGVWADGYYMSTNDFTNGLSFSGRGMTVFERQKMLQGLPAQMINFRSNALGGFPLPADLNGLPPPAGTPNPFVAVNKAAGLVEIWDFVTNWANPLVSTFGNAGAPNQTLAVAAFASALSNIPQAGTASLLSSLGDRPMYAFAMRYDGASLHGVVNHSFNNAGRAGIKVYELTRPIAGAWSVANEVSHSPADTIFRWMGSVRQDKDLNTLLGYSTSSTTTFPSIAWAGRLAGDPANTFGQTEVTAFTGLGSQTGTNSRWGDYSSMQLDVDGCTFWYTQEYYPAGVTSFNWRTRVVTTQYPSCAPLVNLVPTITSLDPNGWIPAAPGVDVLVTGTNFVPGSTCQFDGANRLTDVLSSTQLRCSLIAADLAVEGIFPITVVNPPINAAGGGTSGPLNFTVSASFPVSNLQFSAAASAAPEGAGAVLVTVQRLNASVGAVSAVCSVTGGTASAGDYTMTSALVSWADGETADKTCTLTPTNDGAVEPAETLILGLTNFTGAATSAPAATRTHTIQNDDYVDGACTYGGPPVPIPDNNVAGVQIPLNCGGISAPIEDVNLTLNLTHTYVGDLRVVLIAPNASSIVIVDVLLSCGGNNVVAVFDDQATQAAASTCHATTGWTTGPYRPLGLLSAFNGSDPNGIWMLRVSDNAAADLGSVNSFSIGFSRNDPAKPVITGSRLPVANANGWNNTSVVVSFTCADPPGGSGIATDTVAGATVSGDGAAQSVTNSGQCIDNATLEADPVTVTGISIDTVDPETFLDTTPPASTTSTSATFTFHGEDSTPCRPSNGPVIIKCATFASGSGIDFAECNLDGAGWVVCDSDTSQTYAGLGAGAHSFEVRAVDLGGNKDETPATYAWFVIIPIKEHQMSATARNGADVLIAGRNPANQLWYKETTGGVFGAWINIPLSSAIMSRPEAIRANNGDIYIFYRGAANDLRYVYRPAASAVFGSSMSLGGVIGGDPVALLDGSLNMMIVAKTPGNQPFYRRLPNLSTTFGAWTPLDGILPGELELVQQTNGRLFLLGLDAFGSLFSKEWNDLAQTWDSWIQLGGVTAGRPAAATVSGGTFVFALTPAGSLFYIEFISPAWGPWTQLGGVLAGSTDAAAAAGKLFVWGTNPPGGLWDQQTPNGVFSGYEFLGGVLATGPEGAPVGNHFYVFANDPAGGTWTRKYDFPSGTWGVWTNLGGVLATVP